MPSPSGIASSFPARSRTAVAKADPDGYTLMMINDNHALNPSVFKNIPYDSVKDFAPIGFVGYTPLVFDRQRQRCRCADVKELVEAAKQKPGTITYGSVGVGSASHLAGEMLAGAADINGSTCPIAAARRRSTICSPATCKRCS